MFGFINDKLCHLIICYMKIKTLPNSMMLYKNKIIAKYNNLNIS